MVPPLLLVATLLGGLAFWRYQQSETLIRNAVSDFGDRGSHLDAEQCVEEAIDTLKRRGIGLAAFIIDTIASSGGVIAPLPGYLSAAARIVYQPASPIAP